MNELSPEARRLFRLARPGDEPSADALRRVESSIQTRLASGAAIATVGTLATKAAAGVASTLPWIKIVSSIGLTVTMGGAGWWGTHLYMTSVPKPRPVAANAAAASAHRAAPTVSLRNGAALAASSAATDPASEPEEHSLSPVPQSRSAKTVASPNAVVVAKGEDPLRAEIVDLRLAQQALRAGDAPKVLSLLSEQDAAYSNGALREERAAAKVLALCQMGRVVEARDSAEQFERRWPKSSLMARLRNSCWKP